VCSFFWPTLYICSQLNYLLLFRRKSKALPPSSEMQWWKHWSAYYFLEEKVKLYPHPVKCNGESTDRQLMCLQQQRSETNITITSSCHTAARWLYPVLSELKQRSFLHTRYYSSKENVNGLVTVQDYWCPERTETCDNGVLILICIDYTIACGGIHECMPRETMV